jgi:hypothetical protein
MRDCLLVPRRPFPRSSHPCCCRTQLPLQEGQDNLFQAGREGAERLSQEGKLRLEAKTRWVDELEAGKDEGNKGCASGQEEEGRLESRLGRGSCSLQMRGNVDESRGK